MSQEHPITPPPELVQQWIQGWYDDEVKNVGVVPHVATQAARWGADQELEACCEWLRQNVGRWEVPEALRDARRPKPPSLKEQALEQLECVNGILRNQGIIKTDTIRRALEALPDD